MFLFDSLEYIGSRLIWVSKDAAGEKKSKIEEDADVYIKERAL